MDLQSVVSYLAQGFVALVALIHFGFGWKEYSNRNKREFYDAFKIELAEGQKPDQIGRIVVNAALFNVLLAAGLLVSLWFGKPGMLLQVYLLVAIIIAGIVGGMTLKPAVAVLQSGPAAIALFLVWWGSSMADFEASRGRI